MFLQDDGLVSLAGRCVFKMGAFSLQFCDFLYQNEEVLKFFHIKRNGFSIEDVEDVFDRIAVT